MYLVLCFYHAINFFFQKNFVGLATDGEYIACGSENNSVYVYYKGLPKKLMSFRSV